MKHIAIDARIINSTTGRYVERLVTHLQAVDKDNRYTILVRKKDKDFWRPSAPNFSVMVAEYDQYSFAEQLGFKRFLDKLGADLVHFCMPQQPVLYRGLKVTTFHDLSLLRVYNTDKNWLIYHAKQLVGRQVFRTVARQSRLILTPSQFTKDDLIAYAKIPAEKVIVTYESADILNNTPEPVELPFKRYIMYVGQQAEYKNLKRLAAATQILMNKYPDLGLVLVGRENPETLANKAYFEKKGYKNIHFTGYVSDEKLAWLYKHTDAYIFPSLSEGFGLPGLEAIGCGAPVVSSSATCLPEIYDGAAHYFDPLDVEDMAESIGEVLSDSRLRAKLKQTGESILKKYSWTKMARETHAAYMKALKEAA